MSNVMGPDTAPNRNQKFEQLVDQYQRSVLHITAEDPAYPDGLIMQRKFSDPVRLKLLPYNDKMEESDDRCYQYEYVTVWVYNQDDPEEMLNKLFPFV